MAMSEKDKKMFKNLQKNGIIKHIRENLPKQYFVDYIGVEDILSEEQLRLLEKNDIKLSDIINEAYEYKIDINKDDICAIYWNKGTKEQYEAWLSFDFILFWDEENKELTPFAKTLVRRMCDIAGN